MDSLLLDAIVEIMIALLLNVLWIVFGGLYMAVAWLIAAFIMAITIIGLPWARAALTIAGTRCCRSASARYRGRVYRAGGHRHRPFGSIGNLIWLVFAGWWLALGH